MSREPGENAGRALRWWTGDVTDPERVQTVVEEITAGFGRLDVVVNNAGYAEPGAFEEFGDDARSDRPA